MLTTDGEWGTPAVDEVDWKKAAWQFLSALRREQSQRELSRLLGYRSNVVSNWEACRRFPTAERALAICEKLGIDVLSAFASFAPNCVEQFHAGGLASWLEALRRGKSIAMLVRASGRSRHAITRWLKGRARPKLPEFLMLVHAITGRVPELVGRLVPLNDVRVLADLEQRLRAVRSQALRDRLLR